MIYIIGIDPGPTPGLVGLGTRCRAGEKTPFLASVDTVQCSHSVLISVLDGLWDSWNSAVRLAVEQFVVGPRASRSRTSSAGVATRELINEIERWAKLHSLPEPVLRRAADVKPWATDTRLHAAGLLLPMRGLQHARDAARHALFSAVKDHGLPDPLSQKAAAL